MPQQALLLVKQLMAWPTIRLAICGPINPIKEIEPATATATDDSTTATKNNTMRSLPTLTPKSLATCSCVLIMFNSLDL